MSPKVGPVTPFLYLEFSGSNRFFYIFMRSAASTLADSLDVSILFYFILDYSTSFLKLF